MTDLVDVAAEHLAAARASKNGRSAQLLLHDGVLRQTVIALVAGTELAEHNSPHAASLQVLSGRVRVTGVDEAEVPAGRLVLLTHQRHAVAALEDSVFLLTTVTGLDEEQVAPR
ncbi:cupin [Actinotalea sp. K2]|uniref:cupin n=1 Tax=Actinotalea sp. K2 TaxID=2939438 RepID=UPI002016DBE5|nr:cupin [Actinotalea sp. K2]MCL3861107.1 cupin [Actinotalea sp. K2]